MAAYSESYLSDAMENMGEMMEYASIACGLDMNDFFMRLRISGIASDWESGDPIYISGMSGTELCRRVIELTSDNLSDFPPALICYDTGAEYWCGWIMAYLQWRLDASFAAIMRAADFDELMRIYPVMHTASEERCAAYVAGLMSQTDTNVQSRLQFYRHRLGLTQRQLAERSDVNLRTLQQYESGSKDIKKAAAVNVIRLAHTLHCTPEDLIY